MTSSVKKQRRSRWLRRAKRVILAGFVLHFLAVGVVLADTGGENLGQATPMLSWITLTDEKGINAWQYELSIDYKTGMFETDIVGGMWAQIVYLLWDLYRSFVVLTIWFLDWVLSLDWLTLLTDPLTAVGVALRNVIDQSGLVPAFLAVTALAGGLYILRGKIATGVYEILVGAFIVALSTTTLAAPMALVAGEGGWIHTARDRTLEVVSEMGDTASGDHNALTSQLITTFVRQPTQLTAFGKILDGGDCEDDYDEVVKGGPYGFENNIRDKIASCDSGAGDYAKSPTGTMAMGALMQVPAGGTVLLIGVLIGGAIMLALVQAVLAALQLIINLVVGVLPKGARQPLAKSFAEVVGSLFIFIMAMFFLAIFLQLINQMFEAHSSEPSKAYVYVNVFLVLGLVSFVKYRKGLKGMSDRLAAAMMRRPSGGTPSALPSSRGLAAMGITRGAYRLARSPMARKAAATLVGGPAGAAINVAGGAISTIGKTTGKTGRWAGRGVQQTKQQFGNHIQQMRNTNAQVLSWQQRAGSATSAGTRSATSEDSTARRRPRSAAMAVTPGSGKRQNASAAEAKRRKPRSAAAAPLQGQRPQEIQPPSPKKPRSSARPVAGSGKRHVEPRQVAQRRRPRSVKQTSVGIESELNEQQTTQRGSAHRASRRRHSPQRHRATSATKRPRRRL